MNELAPKLCQALGRVVACACSDAPAVRASWISDGEWAGAAHAQAALAALGHSVTQSTAHAVWELVSLNLQAGWIDGPDNIEHATGEILALCRDVAAGCDRAGISKLG